MGFSFPIVYMPVDAVVTVSLFDWFYLERAVFQPTYGRVLFTSYHCQLR